MPFRVLEFFGTENAYGKKVRNYKEYINFTVAFLVCKMLGNWKKKNWKSRAFNIFSCIAKCT